MTYCLSWINVVWEQMLIGWFVTKKYSGDISLPDEILVEILSRLPAESVLECRRVCKYWNSLTSTPDFIEKHLKNATPAIHIAYKPERRHEKEERVFIIDEWAGKAKGDVKLLNKSIKRLRSDSIFPVPLPVSQRCKPKSTDYINGLLLFVPQYPLIKPCQLEEYNPLGIRTHIICNPVTREKIVLNTYRGFICACFYHPLAREYRVIWLRSLANLSFVEFRILNLGSEELCWRRLANFHRQPRYYNVLLINEALHWMISDERLTKTLQPCCNESIIMFNINKEEFSTMPHPGDKCNMSWRRHLYMHLVELKSDSRSLLSLCDCSMEDQIDMWVLEDYESRVWVRRHRIIIEMDMAHHPSAGNSWSYEVYPFGIHNGEILIHWRDRGVFAYHLNKGTMRKINELIARGMGITDDNIVHVGMHHMSLVSFTNFKHRGLHINMEP